MFPPVLRHGNRCLSFEWNFVIELIDPGKIIGVIDAYMGVLSRISNSYAVANRKIV